MESLHTVVIKVGTDVITDNGVLNERVMREIVEQIAAVRQHVGRIAIVSSGAVAAGRALLGRKKKKRETIREKQKYACVGQVPLMAKWAELFQEKKIVVAQGLLTGKNFDSKSESHNIRDALDEIYHNKKKIIPIFNENDLVATRELKLSDNDELAGHLAELMHAQKVMLLTSVHGIYRDAKNPRTRVKEVAAGSKKCEKYIDHGTSTPNGTGNAGSKVRVAQRLSAQGIETIVAHGREEQDVIRRVLLLQESLGTRFRACLASTVSL